LKKVNLANVRSAIGVTIATVALLSAVIGWGSPLNFFGEASAAVEESEGEKVQDAPTPTRPPPSDVVLAFVPRGTTPQRLAQAGFSPGLMSAGLGSVPAAQTYLDIGQGNRVFDSLYDPSDLPPLGTRCRNLEAIERRAESAPAEIEPFLLTHELVQRGGAVVFASGKSSCAFGITDGHGEGGMVQGTLDILDASLARSAAISRHATLVIAIERPPPAKDRELSIGIAGRGFDGNLTSDSTRLDGYVLSTDVAPTILDFFDVSIPDEMSGQPIRSEGDVDPAAVESLGDRMAVISERRGPVIGLSLLAWTLGFAIAAAAFGPVAARRAAQVVGLSVVYLPLVLLLGAAIEPSEGVEIALTVALSPLLAWLTLSLVGGYRALAVASGATVLATAIDVIAGSPLTALSLLGPNPGLGVRFYGIGNELEALLAVLVIAGTGAALAGFAPHLARSRAAAGFLVVGLGLAFVFAVGRFGADVGAAIVLPFGAAVAAAAIGARGLRSGLLIVAAPIVAVALLAVIDLATGANSHLTRSVLDAGGLDQVAEVAQRRLELSAHSFARPIVYFFMPLVVAVAVWAYLQRDRIAGWLRDVPPVRAGMIGALAAVLIGALANDSGALVIEIGAAYLVAFLGFAWAEN
jgi:hypothetical protein